MKYGDKNIDSIVFYDKETKEVCAMVSDEDIVIPENCEVAIFPIGTQPVFTDVNGTVILNKCLLFDYKDEMR